VSGTTLPAEGEWRRRVWRLALPIVAANALAPLVGVVDTAVVGHLPALHYLGGVAIGTTLFSFLYWGLGFLRMGTTGLVAQAYGAGDHDELRAVLARALLAAAALGVVLVAARQPIADLAFLVMAPSMLVEAAGRTYVGIRIVAAPAVLANWVVLGWLIGVQRVRAALLIQVVMNGLNMALAVLFVFGLGWQVAGVAAATAISEYAAAAMGLWLLARLLGRLPGRLSRARILERAGLVRTFAINRDIFIRTVCLQLGHGYFTVLGARMGDAMLAANAVLWNFLIFAAYALDGFAHAAEALVGGAVGARDRRALGLAVRHTTVLAGAVSFGLCVFYGVLGPTIIDLLTTLPEVRAAALIYLPWAVALPLVAVWSYQLDGIFIGATRGADMRNGMIVALLVFGGATLVLVPAWGNHGVWLSLHVFVVARALALWARYPALAASAA